MKIELMIPDEFVNLIAEKIVDKLKPLLLEARPSEMRPIRQEHEEIDPMRALNDHEVALLVGKTVQTLRNERHLGRGAPYFKVGKAVRYRRGDVLRWLDAQRVEPRR